MSSDNIGNTREHAKKLLSGMGVRTEIVEVDGLRALKCRYEDVKGESLLLTLKHDGTQADEIDFNSGTTLTKGVRFRIEFSRSSPMSSGGYNTLVSLTQEKGAQSTFRCTPLTPYLVHSRLTIQQSSTNSRPLSKVVLPNPHPPPSCNSNNNDPPIVNPSLNFSLSLVPEPDRQ